MNQIRNPHLGRAAVSAMQDLLARIESGEFSLGQQLPSERELANLLGVARNTLRAALQQLESDGFLTRQIGRGTFVAQIPNRSSGSFLSRRMRNASPADLMEVRLIIEPHVAALAASRGSNEDIDRIQIALRTSLSARGLAEFEHWDAELHLAIFHATKNALLVDYCDAINAIRNEPSWYRLKKRTVSTDTRTLYDQQHSAIVQAIADRDPETAQKLMTQHMSSIRDNMLGVLG
ncbi:FadR/GntR family transcriptional regulator [Fodinicurvata halophila]|uniref:FadR/GntR family transcriptional regulator n=2 Tax=Fodinicurvata halophila TaxID=1419723 RepID=A0ABV8UGC6_9PROT